MTITLEDAKTHLNMTEDTEDTELEFWVDVANDWVATQVSDTSPNPVQGATRILVAHLWETQRGPAGPLDDDPDVTISGVSFAIPNRVKELLGPYLASATPAAVQSSFPDAVTDWPDDNSAVSSARWLAL